MPKTIQVSKDDLCFSATPSFAPAANDDNGLRQFSGVAYSGAVVSRGWGDIIIDLASTQHDFKEKVGVLLNHNIDRRAGKGKLAIVGGQLHINGHLMSNKHGKEVAKDSDDGFPWEMSVRVHPGSIEELASGVQVDVNGQTVTGPINIFRNNIISEVSFTPIGADRNTNARALSDDAGEFLTLSIQETGTMPDPKNKDAETQAQLSEVQGQLLALQTKFSEALAQLSAEAKRADTAEATLTEQKKVTRLSTVKDMLGDKFSDETAEPYMGMTDVQFSAVAELAKSQKRDLPEGFFSEEEQGETFSDKNPLLDDAKQRSEQV